MSVKTEIVGRVDNPRGITQKLDVPTVILVLGGAAIGTYIGLQIGGSIGAAVGALIGAFVGALAACMIKNFRVRLKQDGEVEVQYETRFA